MISPDKHKGRWVLAWPTETLLRHVGRPGITRNQLAPIYALAFPCSDDVDWQKVNLAIVKRWSRNGLQYIKRRAWKIAKGEMKP